MGKTHVDWITPLGKVTDQITVYPSCPFACKYCWSMNSELMKYRIKSPKPIEEAERYAKAREPKIIVISFTTDPYQPKEFKERKTRRILEILGPTKHTIMILTKNPTLIDFDLMSKFKNIWLGSTLTALNKILDEPNAPGNDYRIRVLEYAHSLGINTYASIEPILPEVTDVCGIIEKTHEFINWYVIGRLNYETKVDYPKVSDEYYVPILNKAVQLLEKYGKKYYIKKELRTKKHD